MDPEFFFEIKEGPTEISEVDTPNRINSDISNEYKNLNYQLDTIHKNNPEVAYIINKFKDPSETYWMFGDKYATQLIFIPKNITNSAAHCFAKKTLLKEKFGTPWIKKAILNNKNKIPTNLLITEADGINFVFLNNPVVTSALEISESNLSIPIKKFDYINCGPLPVAISESQFKDSDVLYLSNIHSLQKVLSKHLNVGGYAQFNGNSYQNFFKQDYYFMYLLKLCFDKVILFRTTFIMCIGFKGIPSEIMNIKKYAVVNTDISKLKNFVMKNVMKLSFSWKQYIIDGNFVEFFNFAHKCFLQNKKLMDLSIDIIDNDSTLFALRTVKKNPEKINNYLSAGINEQEGTFLFNIIFNNKFKKLVEVGMANGISAAYMTGALKELGNGKLISIDPFQKSQWKNNGIDTIAAMKTKTYHKLVEEKSFDALPKLLSRNKDQIDLVFVDGWHTFDYTLVDIFYGVLLLRIGGFLIIDDALHPGVANTLKYLDTNYTMMKRIAGPRSFGVYQKIKDDTRDWDFHRKF